MRARRPQAPCSASSCGLRGCARPRGHAVRRIDGRPSTRRCRSACINGLSARTASMRRISRPALYGHQARLSNAKIWRFLSTFGEGQRLIGADRRRARRALGDRVHRGQALCGDGGLHAPLDALFEIGAKRTLRAGEIEPSESTCYARGLSPWLVGARAPADADRRQMNIAYAIAVALIDGEAMLRQFAAPAHRPGRRLGTDPAHRGTA